MANRAKKKERHKHKRQERKRSLSLAKTGSPYRKAGQSGEIVACYASAEWRSDGSTPIFVLRRAQGGSLVLAAFFVDLWCAGLKDAWGRLDITMKEFNDRVLNGKMAYAVDLVRIDLDLARYIVAGGIRFARQNGFRLPRRYQRWTSVLGDIGDSESADLSDFGVDGRLRWVGPMADLKARLIGCSVDEFLSREDVEYVTGDDDFAMPDDAAVAVEEVADDLYDRWLNAVRKWCFSNGIKPHPRMAEALEIMLESILQSSEAAEIEDESGAADLDVVSHSVDQCMDGLDPKEANELAGAIAQLACFSGQFESPDDMFDFLGIDELGDSE